MNVKSTTALHTAKLVNRCFPGTEIQKVCADIRAGFHCNAFPDDRLLARLESCLSMLVHNDDLIYMFTMYHKEVDIAPPKICALETGAISMDRLSKIRLCAANIREDTFIDCEFEGTAEDLHYFSTGFSTEKDNAVNKTVPKLPYGLDTKSRRYIRQAVLKALKEKLEPLSKEEAVSLCTLPKEACQMQHDTYPPDIKALLDMLYQFRFRGNSITSEEGKFYQFGHVIVEPCFKELVLDA